MPNRKWRVLRPVKVFTQRDTNGQYLASSYWLNSYGVGDSETEAMSDLMISLPELLEAVQGERLGSDMQRTVDRIKTYIEPRKQ